MKRLALVLVLVAALPVAAVLAASRHSRSAVRTGRPHPASATTARLTGAVDPGGRRTRVRFRYGRTKRYGALTPAIVLRGDHRTHRIAQVVGGLAPGTTYHVQLTARSRHGLRRGADRTFRTPSTPPPLSAAPSTAAPATSQPAAKPAAANVVHATGYTRQTLYHSPQSPGATAWTGAWTMPDGSVMTAFTQATGPVDPSARSHLAEPALNALGLTEVAGRTGYSYVEPNRDFSGLSQSVIYLRSADGGQSWQQWRTDPFHALFQQAMTPQATIALPDGTLVRRVSGIDMGTDASFPRTAALEHLSGASGDWSAPQTVLSDPSVCTYQISRIRPLSDGRYVALGQAWRYASGQSGPCAKDPFSDLLLVAGSASDVESGNWSLGMPYTSGLYPAEWDVAELPGGDLLAMFRTTVKGGTAPMEATLHRTGSTWSMDPPHPMPGVAMTSNSGHPELLAAQEGVVLEFSAGAVSYTADGGASWHQLAVPQGALHAAWYPRAVQAGDGTIYAFSHVGFDDAYGATDQRIIVDRFKLAVDG